MISLILISIILQLFAIYMARKDASIFLYILFFSHLYFCAGGYFYWVFYRSLNFVGVNWGLEDVAFGIAMLSTSTTLVAVIVACAFGDRPLPSLTGDFSPTNRAANVFLVIGSIAALYVILFGIGKSEDATGDSLLLIAYQFSDCLIPAIVFRVARKPTAGAFSLVLLFLIYAVLVGFRYKIALLCIPLIVLKLVKMESSIRKWVHLITASSAILFLFSAMTVFRVKLGVPDFSRQIGGLDGMLYNFFAESNIIFAMAVIVKNFLEGASTHFPLSPIAFSVLGLIPRFLLPERAGHGEYLDYFNSLFPSAEGESSGTAYPFIGEFMIMGGYSGLVFGVILYAMLYIFLHKYLVRHTSNRRVLFAGLGLLAAQMGYYHYTRGYMPAQLKSYIFVLLPYFVICNSERSGMIRHAKLRRRLLLTRNNTN